MPPQYSQKYTVVCFFDPQETTTNFSAEQWPLHVTMLDTFKTDWPPTRLRRALGDAAASTAAFDVVPIQEALLGEAKDVPVKLLSLDGGISALHRQLMEVAVRGAFSFNTPAFVGDGFLPHVTDQTNAQAEAGQTYHLGSLSLIDMFPGSDHTRREVVDTYNFTA